MWILCCTSVYLTYIEQISGSICEQTETSLTFWRVAEGLQNWFMGQRDKFVYISGIESNLKFLDH
jgi:hypothetical protein